MIEIQQGCRNKSTRVKSPKASFRSLRYERFAELVSFSKTVTPTNPQIAPVRKAPASVATFSTADNAQPLDIQQIRLTVGEPEWWGSMMVSALRPVDPLTESIRPLTDSLQTALELLTPRSGRTEKRAPGKNTSSRSIRSAAHWT